jgi:hypothetical protein
MDQVAGPTWQTIGEANHAGVRPRLTGCAATDVETSLKSE